MGSAQFRCNFDVIAMLELEGPVTLVALQEAALRVQQQHQALQVEVVDEPGRPGHFVFRSCEQLIRVEAVEGRHPGTWREVWDQLAHTQLAGLAWRVVWVQAPGARVGQLLVGFHHSISDIGSLSVFFDALVKALHEVHSGLPSPSEVTPLHGALSRVVRSRWPIAALARCAWYRYFRRLRTLPLDRPEHVPVEHRRWAGAFRSVAPDGVEALVERCRAHGVTLSHAVSAAAILEIADRVRLREGPRPFDVALNTSLDLRRFSERLNPRQMGLLVTVVQTFYRPRATDDVWSLAARVKQGIAAVKARNEHRDFALAPNLLGPRVAAWLVNQNQGRPAEGGLIVSNFGRLGDLAHGEFSARRIFFTAAQAAFGCSLLFASGTLRGNMFIHLGHPSPAISPGTGAAVVDGVLERVGVKARAGADLDAN